MITPEQLSRFAELVNGRWGASKGTVEASYRHNLRVDWRYDDGFDNTSPIYFMRHHSGETAPDRVNAEFIVWAWDRLFELGKDPAIGKRYEPWAVVLDNYYWDCPLDMFQAETRAEAVFLALLSVMEERC